MTTLEGTAGRAAASPATESVVIQIAAPDMLSLENLGMIADFDPRIEVITCAYEDSWDFRVAKSGIDASVDELKAEEPVPTPEQAAAFGRAEILLTHDTPLDLPDHAPNLRWVHSIGSGVGNLRYVPLTEHGITLTNSRGVASVPVAEFALARILMIWKRFPELAEAQLRHEWVDIYGRELSGCTIGIVGAGEIGSALAVRAKACGLRVIATRRSFVEGMTLPGVDVLSGPDGLDGLLAESDFVVLALPANAETVDLFDAETFAKMKPGSVFCNVARGSLVDEGALVDALASGHIRCAALDVVREEPLPASSPLWDVPNLYLSPHCAVSLDRYFPNVLELFLDNLDRYLEGKPLRNIVDPSQI